MPPRNAKVKKAADVKVAETAMLIEGSGEASCVAGELPAVEITNKVATEKKPKRGRKAVENGDEQTNETMEIVAPAAKRGKQNAEPSENGDNFSGKEESPPTADQEMKNGLESNGQPEDAPSVDGKGKKKHTKKNAAQEKTAPENDHKDKPTTKGKGRRAQPKTDQEKEAKTDNGDTIEKSELLKPGRKNIQPKAAKVLAEEDEIQVEKPADKPSKEVKSGKKKGQTKPIKDKTPEKEEESTEEEGNKIVNEPVKEVKSGRKKAQTKVVKDKKPKQEEELTEVENENLVVEPAKEAKSGKKKGQSKVAKEGSPEAIEPKGEDKVPEELKKETKSKRNQGKRAPTKAEAGDKDSQDDKLASKKKASKKDENEKGDAEEEAELVTEEIAESKPVKGKRGAKKVTDAPTEPQEVSEDTGEPNKRKRKVTEEKGPTDDSKKKALKNKASTNYEMINFSNNSKNAQGKEWNFKISAWNVDGIRAWLTKGGLDFINYEKPDILCLQEVKCSQDKLPEEIANLPGYHAYWLCSDKDGYAGVGIYTTKLAMNVQYGLQNTELDDEGRIITAEYEEFFLVSTYVVNAGRKLVTLPRRLQWNEEFRRHVKELDKKKPVIICGDMNVAHNEIDLKNPKTNRKNAGFTDEERSGMSDLLGDGFVDTFRHLNPDKTEAYTFWTYMMNCRAKNVGWRLDYFIVSERLLPAVCDSVIRSEVYGSDHCPISLFLHLTSAQMKPKELE